MGLGESGDFARAKSPLSLSIFSNLYKKFQNYHQPLVVVLKIFYLVNMLILPPVVFSTVK